MKLNTLTSYNTSFGYCAELGPVAFIGIINLSFTWKDGYFVYNIQEYGSPFEEKEYYFKAYTKEEAATVVNYTVYGFSGIEEIAKFATISKLAYVFDSRYKAKTSRNSKVYDMDCKLKGKYSYNEAKLLSTGTIRDKEWFCGEDKPIVFARLEDGRNIGIINMWPEFKDKVLGFRDVWEYEEVEPKIQKISFLSKEKACKIKDYELYIYCHNHSYKKFNVEKYDRTFDSRFNFHLPDGRDYRLIEH